MPEIDDERLEYLMELVTKEHPDLDRYVVWVLCVNQLLNEQGIYGDEKVAQKLYEQARGELKFNVRVE